MHKRSLILWIAAVIVTLSSVVYQRMTGPTYPVGGDVRVGGEAVRFGLLRSHDTTSDARIEIAAPNQQTTGHITWRRFKSNDAWTRESLDREGDKLFVDIPRQPPAGKVIYEITLVDAAGTEYQLTDEPVIMRFKGPVPAPILIPHIVLMFAAMLLATRTGLEALASRGNAYGFAVWTTALLCVGGLILGPTVQKYAFGEFWTGWPFGHDLTDTKTAAAVIPWLVALWRGRKPGQGRVWMVIAAAVTLLVYLVPHSTLGSELDYTEAGRQLLP